MKRQVYSGGEGWGVGGEGWGVRGEGWGVRVGVRGERWGWGVSLTDVDLDSHILS